MRVLVRFYRVILQGSWIENSKVVLVKVKESSTELSFFIGYNRSHKTVKLVMPKNSTAIVGFENQSFMPIFNIELESLCHLKISVCLLGLCYFPLVL